MRTTFKGIKITGKLIAEGIEQDNKEHRIFCNKFRVYLNYMGFKTSFEFSGSHHDYQNGKTELDEKDLTFALYCFLSDAQAGSESFDGFCSEFGYDTDSRKAENVYRLCQRSTAKLAKMNLPAEMIESIYETCG